MPCCDTGRNVQKYRGGGGGASTLQEALENGNIATVAIELQSNGLFIGDGGGLSNIAGVGGSVGNMQQVTTSGATTSNKIILTNTNESLETSGNINVGNNKFYLGDGGLLSNTAGTVTLQQASNQGNVINNTVSFTNAAESIVTTGNVIVSTNVHATEFFGDGTTLTGIALSTDMTSNAARVTSLESSVTTNTGDITSLETDMTSNAARVSSLETDMTSNASRITATETDVTSNASRITSLETDMTSNASRVSSLETDMTSNASRVSSLETDMTSNASRITTTETDMTSNAARVSSLESSVTTNTSDITSLETDMTSNASRVSSLETDMTSNASRITTTETNMTSNAARVSSLESSVTTNTSDITSLETDMTSNASRISSLETDMTSNASRVSSLESETQPVDRGGTGNTFSSASKSDLLVGTSGGTFATLSIPSSSANGKVLKINASDELYWGADNTSSGGGGGGSGVLSLGTYMSYASGTDYDTSTGETINLDASTTDSASNIVVRDTNKNINVTKVTLGSTTLTETEYSGKSSTVTVGTDNGGTARSLAFVDGNSILKDDSDNLAWTPSSKSLRLGPSSSGTSNTLTNVLWSGKSSKIAIGNSDTAGEARPVLYGIGEIANKDTSDRLNWTPGGTHAGTLTIGTISGDHSNITASTFTGESANVKITSNTHSTPLNIALTNTTDSNTHIVTDTDGDFTYKPDDGTLKIKSGTLESIITPSTFSGESANVKITTNTSSTPLNIALTNTTDSNTHIVTDTDGDFTYKPDDSTLKIKSGGLESIITPSTFSGESANVKVTSNTHSTALHIALTNTTDSNTHIVKDTVKDFTYKPSDGTVTATKFSGDGSGLSSLSPSALSSAVGSALGGTGQTEYTTGDILYANNDSTPVLVRLPADNGKFLKSTSTGVAWSTVSASTVPVTDDTTSTSVQGITFAASTTGSQTIKSHQSTLHYKPSTGTLTTSNLITSGTSQFNGIANTAPNHTLSVGQVFSIQEWNGSGTPIDVMVVRKGNAYFEGNVYVGKTLTIPTVLEADTIKVRSHNVSGTTVINERKASVQRID